MVCARSSPGRAKTRCRSPARSTTIRVVTDRSALSDVWTVPSAWACGAIGPGSTGTWWPARNAASVSRTHWVSWATEAGSVRDRAITVRPSRACSASRTICSTSTPTYGARSVLLTISTSARAMPGPPLRATSPPPATSSTKNWASTRAGENVAVRLSPPDSTSTTSTGAKSRSRSSTASRFWVTSSRIAVCGQAPVSTARIRSGGQHAGRAQEPGVLVGVDVVGDHRQAQLAAQLGAQQGDQRALAGADRAGHAQPQRAGHGVYTCSSLGHVRRPSAGTGSAARSLPRWPRSARRGWPRRA